MKKVFCLAAVLFLCGNLFAQDDAYTKSMQTYQKNYVDTHEVVKKKDRKYFRFFPISSKYDVTCSFEKITDNTGFTMPTSAKTLKYFYKYGRLNFKLDGKDYHLFVYQGKDLMETEEYKDYLFVPFTDATSGDESYGSGRYIEFHKQDVKNNTLQLDFNKAYNPYCAYSAGYKCPIPPRENALSVAIRAGEKNFAKGH